MTPTPGALRKQRARGRIAVSPGCYHLLRRLAPRRGIGALVYELAQAEAKRRRLGDTAKPVDTERLQDEQDQPIVPVTEQQA